MNNTITLPEAVYPSAENSTYAYPIMYMNATSMTNETYTPSPDAPQPPSIPFLNFPPQMAGNSTTMTPEATSASSSATVPEATSSTSGAAASVSSAIETATAPVVSAVSAASSAAPAAPTKRDVTAAKRRWVGQQ